jgi:hypothetical protein
VFIIEDELHAELLGGGYPTLEDALAVLRVWAELPWDDRPNAAPCANWRACGRRYEIVEYDVSMTPWREMRRLPVLEVSAGGTRWVSEIEP